MNKFYILFLFILCGCENLIYEKYRIVDFFDKEQSRANTYYVNKGDNLFSISKKFNISIREIIEANNIRSPYRIYPKQKIIIPTQNVHIVKEGDTLYSISRNYNIDVFSISKVNKITNINQINKGQKIIIPATSLKYSKKNINKNLNSLNKKVTKNKKKINIEKNTKGIFQEKKKLNISRDLKFIWPIKGKVISKFGSQSPGFFNDGINIVSSKGMDVKASDDGKIIYTGNEIPGYGNLILIKHSKNWITAYAHLDEIFFKKDSSVKKGESIGSVGNSGNVKNPQLHFEIRKGKEAVDPLQYLS